MATSGPLVAVWLDRSIGEKDAYLKLKERFQGVSDRITEWHYFDCGDPFLEFIEKNPSKQIIVIMTGNFAKLYLASISNRNNIHSVYILCVNVNNYKNLINTERKLQGVFNHEDDLYRRLQLFFSEQ